jgi:hypothetical protein
VSKNYTQRLLVKMTETNGWLSGWRTAISYGIKLAPGALCKTHRGKRKRFRDPEAGIILIEYLVTGVPIKTSSSD